MVKARYSFAEISSNDRHVRVRVATSLDGEHWATNGFLVFTPEEWDAFRRDVIARYDKWSHASGNTLRGDEFSYC